MIQFTVYGPPKPQARHRMGKGFSYDPSAKIKQDFVAAVQEHRPETPLKGPLKILLSFFFPRPKSHYRTGKRSDELKDDAPTYYTCKGRNDWDNLGKLVCDALNGIMFEDDGQIAVAGVTKRYSDKPRTVVQISVITED
jgi:Holliday junction resolvase RusA-like endonuclease